MVKQYFSLFLFFFSVISSSQDKAIDTTMAPPRVFDDYVERYADAIKVRLGFSNSFNSFHIKDKEDHVDFTLSPNQRVQSTLTLIYKFIEIDLGYTPAFIRFNKDDDSRGTTKFLNFGTRFYVGKWMQELQYAKTKGFYVDKHDLGVAENFLFPDFNVQKIGGSTSYIFNPNFSFRAIFLQSEWQKKSTGSFVPSISYYFTRIENNDPGKDHIIDVALGPAYYYNWVIARKFLVSAGAYGGIGYNQTKTVYRHTDNMPDETVKGLSFQTQLRLGFGYNSEKIYAGATARLNSFSYQGDPQVHVQDQQQFFELYIGYRFKGPEKIGAFLDNPPLLSKKKTTIKRN